MGFLSKILKTAAPLAANYFVPGSGALVSGMMQGKGTKKNAKNAYADLLRAARPNQTNAAGDQLTWTTDPKTGKEVQTTSYSPERQAQFDSFNRIATGRMGKAEGMTAGLPTGNIDYNKMGLGSLANAYGIGQGDTGKRPWADDKYSSLGGDALKFLQFSEGQGGLVPAQTWGSQPMGGGAPSGGGAALAPPPAPAPQGAPPPTAPSGGGMALAPPGPDPMAAQRAAMMAEEEERKRNQLLQAGMGLPGDRGN
jgi:hypothetical protein